MINNIISAIIMGIILGAIILFVYIRLKDKKNKERIPDKLVIDIKILKERKYLQELMDERSEVEKVIDPEKKKSKKIIKKKSIKRKNKIKKK